MMINRWLSGVLFLSLLSLFFTVTLRAEEAGKPADVRIIVDISGSMKDTDPQNLRIPAVNLLVELLPDNAQSGIWTFGHYVNMLVPLGTVNQVWREQAKKEAAGINSVGLYTNLTGALEKAEWKIAADSGFNQTVILLTDGRIDMPATGGQDANQAERQRLFRDILPVYAAAGAKIHTLALSEGADKALLQQIALETGGMFLQAADADDLLKAFLKAFDRAVPAEQVPMDDNRFDIDSSVKEFTALIFRKPGARETRLIAPSGQVISATVGATDDHIRWHKDVNFDLITVSQPEAGSWQAEADLDPDNRVQILSDLTLSVEGLPNSIFAGNPVELEMALKNAGEVIAEQAILGLTDFTLKVTAPDGRSGSKLLSDPEALPQDGIFRESMTRLSQIGEYRFEITAVGRTFQRRQVLTASLMEPLRVHVEDVPAEQRVHILVTPEGANVDSGLSRVIAKVSSPDGSSLIHTMEFSTDDNGWAMDLTADKGPGRYDVVLNIRGVSVGGATFRSKPDDIIRDFPLVDPDALAAAGGVAGNSDGNETGDTGGTPADVAAAGNNTDTTAAPPAASAGEERAAPVAEEPPAAAAQEEVVPDLASRFAEQETVVEEPPADEGISWWVWLALVAGNLLIFGGAGTWWFMKHRKSPDNPAAAPEALFADDGRGDESLTDEDFAGDFDSFTDNAEEEEIPLPEEKSSIPSSMGSDTDIDVSLDDDFAIDPEQQNAAGGDDWGEFDTGDDDSGKDDTPRP